MVDIQKNILQLHYENTYYSTLYFNYSAYYVRMYLKLRTMVLHKLQWHYINHSDTT